MPSTVPTPVAAALGIVPTVLGGVRRLPGKAISLPIYALSSALTTLDRSRREYDALAERGERLIARLRGVSFDEVEDRVEDALQGTPLAKPYDALEDALEDAAENVTALVRNAPAAARKAPAAARNAPAKARKAASTATVSTGRTLDRAADKVEDLSATAAGTAQEALDEATSTASSVVDAAEESIAGAADVTRSAVDQVADRAAKAGTDAAADLSAGDESTAAPGTDTTAPSETGAGAPSGADTAQDVPEDQAPKGEPTPKATQPDDTRISTAATSDVVDAVERVSSVVGGEVLDHDDLPLPDYDHMTLGSLRGRMRSLDVPQLVQIRDYEKAHADRLPIVTMLDNRIAKLATDPTAPLSGGSPAAKDAAKPSRGKKGSKVSPATGGPAQNPPTGGVPTNPAQPRTTGSPGTNPSSNA
jgi:hypothetical protein